VPLFASMRAEELDRIALGTTEVRLERGQMVFERGDPCIGFHQVVFGQIKLSFTSPVARKKSSS
jgi:CRP-like cAMP-binding protein